MNPDIKRRWMQALRGGAYPQCHYRLKTDDGYSATGILADMWGRDNGINWVTRPESCLIGNHTRLVYLMDDTNERLSLDILNWCALDRESEKLIMELNDGSEFDDIADMIEKYI